jgi:hypothetical protein
MRRTPLTAAGVAVALAFGVGGCGDDEFANDARAPSPLILSASITPTDVTVSPARLGAGAIELIASNLTTRSQRLTLRSQSPTGGADPLQQRTGPINPGDTASLTADLAPGTYRVTTGSAAIAPATIRVGAARRSAQDQLVQP